MRKYTIAGLIITVLGIIVPILWTELSRPNKSLSFELLSKSQLGGISDSLNIRLSIDDKIVDELTIFTIRLRNTGQIPIEKKDYEDSMSLSFPSVNVIYRANIIEKRPINLSTSVITRQQQVFLSPSLLNPGDYITVQMIVKGNPDTPSLLARISGIRAVDRLEPQTTQLTVPLTILLIVLALIFLLFSASFLSSWDMSINEKGFFLFGRLEFFFMLLISMLLWIVIASGLLNIIGIESKWLVLPITLIVLFGVAFVFKSYKEAIAKKFAEIYSINSSHTDK